MDISFASCTLCRIADLRVKIQLITDGEYAAAKREVDALRAELGQPPVPSLQQAIEEKGRAFVSHIFRAVLTAMFLHPLFSFRFRLLNERRLNGAPAITESGTPASSASKRGAAEPTATDTPVKRPRGRPKGSKNKKNLTAAGASSTAGGDAPAE